VLHGLTICLVNYTNLRVYSARVYMMHSILCYAFEVGSCGIDPVRIVCVYWCGCKPNSNMKHSSLNELLNYPSLNAIQILWAFYLVLGTLLSLKC
jgi:hypothetical protein